MKKIIIFGINGMLGNYIYTFFRKNNLEIIGYNRRDFDVLKDNWEKINNLIGNNNIVINCIGLIPQKNNGEKNYFKINSFFPHFLEKESLKNNCKLIHITTDCVFNGLKGYYKNTDKHDAIDIYGISKSLGEPLNSTIIRTSIIGEEIYNKKSFLEWVLNSKNNINGYLNHYWNGITCLQLAKLIKKIIEDNYFWKGVKHLYSYDIVNKYQLACIIKNIYNININIIPYHDIKDKNMTLKGDNKFNIPSIEKQILELKNYDLI